MRPDAGSARLAAIGRWLAARVTVRLRPSALGQVRGNSRALAAGLGFKLVLVPALILLIYSQLFGLQGNILRVSVFEAAMAPMIGASIVAMEHELNPPLLTLMVGVGIPLSFLSLPAWWRILQGF